MYIYVHKMYIEVLCAFFTVFMCVGRVCFRSPTADMYFGLDVVCWTNPPSYARTGFVCSPWHIHANLSMHVFPHPLSTLSSSLPLTVSSSPLPLSTHYSLPTLLLLTTPSLPSPPLPALTGGFLVALPNMSLMLL